MADSVFYQRNLPHRLVPGEYLFITFRLAGTLPRTVAEQLRAQLQQLEAAENRSGPDELSLRRKRYFKHFDQFLDAARTGPNWLARPDVAAAVKAVVHELDGAAFEVVCYCLMPNHAHLLVYLPEQAPLLAQSLRMLKGRSAREANRLLKREGAFWQPESYDHVVRNAAEMERIVAYILENPVQAGLAADWQQWPHSYWRNQ